MTPLLLAPLLALLFQVDASAESVLPRTEPVPAAEVRRAGPVVAMGGAVRYDNSAVWSRLVALAGGKGARYVVFATAAQDPTTTAARTIAALQAHGAVAEHIAVAPRLSTADLKQAVRDPALIEKVRRARGVFFAGGAQERIVDTLQPGGRATPLLEAIRAVHREGGVIAGTSAGAAVMSRVMFRDATDVMSVMKGTLRDGREVDLGLGFVAPDIFVDQHFLRRGRIGRMLPLMQARGVRLGLGVEEDTAAVIDGDEVEVVGPGGVLVVDLAEAVTDPSLGAFNVTGARLTFLGSGDRLNLRTRSLAPAAAKASGQRIDPRAADFHPYFETAPFSLDILGDGALLRAMSHVLDSPVDDVRGLAFDARPDAQAPRDLGFEFRMRKGPETVGWFTSSFGGEAYTVANVLLDVTPVRVAQPLYRTWANTP